MSNMKLGVLILAYRRANSLSQKKLAALLGVDQSYISKIEKGRNVRDIAFLSKLSDVLLISPYKLGIGSAKTEGSTQDYVESGESAIRLAEIARLSGRPEATIREIQPLIWRLEAIADLNSTSKSVRRALGRAKAVVGTAFGDILSKGRTKLAVDKLYNALDLLKDGISATELVTVKIRLGNELRKIGQFDKGEFFLTNALSEAVSINQKGAAAICLARFYEVQGNQRSFDHAVRVVKSTLDACHLFTPTFNQFAFEEVELRGSIRFGSLSEKTLTLAAESSTIGLAPQWTVIRSITIINGLLLTNQKAQALHLIKGALFAAEFCALPQQVERLISLISKFYKKEDPIVLEAQATLIRLTARARLLTE